MIQNNGNIGINIIQPSAQLHIYGTNSSTSSTAFFIQNSLTQSLFTVLNNGNITIGTTVSTFARLSVIGYSTTSNTNTAQFHNSTGTNNALIIRDDGNIGFGTSTPNEQLELTKNLRLINTTQSALGIIYKGSNRFIYDFSYGFNGTVTPTGNNLFFGSAAGNLTIGSNATQTFHSSYNLGIGSSALSSLTTAYNNIGIGASSLIVMSTGNSNIGIGFSSLSSNIAGNKNIAIGYTALFSATTTGNVAIGHNAGSLLSDGVTTLNAPSNSIFIGEATKSLTASQTNEIVIGHLANGNGSNSATLGNTSITKTILQGNVLIGTTVDSGSFKLDVNGAVKTANSSGYYINSGAGAATQVLTLDSGDNMVIRTPLGGDIYVRSNNNVLIRLINDGGINIGGTVATTAPLFKITSGGSFGFGTSSPNTRMSVKSNGLSSSATLLLNMVTSNEETLFSVANNGNTTLGALSLGNSLSSITGRSIIRTTNVNMSGQLEIIPNTTMTASGSPFYLNPNGSMAVGLTSSAVTPSPNTLAAGRLVVGTSISDSSAIFQIDSTTLGFLPPRMTSTQMNAIASPATGLELYNSDARIKLTYNGTAYKSQGVVSGSYNSTGTATTTFTVTFGGTQPNTTYKVNVTPTAALTAALFYVTNKTATTFDVTYLSGLTGTVTFDYTVSQ